jgi:DNA-binding FrmR family transcriptional regulator
MKERRIETLNHIRRIQGQLETLVGYIEEDRDCMDIAMLTTSIAKSMDSLRFRTLEGFILNRFMSGKKDPEKVDLLNKLISLYKK